MAGVHQVARVFAEDREVVRLELTTRRRRGGPARRAQLDADPPVRLCMPGGIDGDLATAAAVVNAISAVTERRGLAHGARSARRDGERRTMLDKSLIGRESEPTAARGGEGRDPPLRRGARGPEPDLPGRGRRPSAAGFPGLVAPPTFPLALTANERFRHSLDLGTRSILHGEQQFEYARPIVAGDRLTVVTRVADVQEKAGRERADGRPGDRGRGAGRRRASSVFRSRATLILRRG